jgi:predicted nucleic acid-binding protein
LIGTAVDTNVFIALFVGDDEAISWARHALEEAATRAVLSVVPVVYAELVAGGRPPVRVETFFSEKGIEVDWEIGEQEWRAAGSRYGSYARDRSDRSDRRCQSGDPGPRRILADFLVGAHALYLGGLTLLSTAKEIFTSYLPELRSIAPESPSRT